MATPGELLSTALAISTKDRARFAQELIASLDDGADVDADEAWLTELERRARDVQAAGGGALEDWSSVRGRLAARWSKR